MNFDCIENLFYINKNYSKIKNILQNDNTLKSCLFRAKIALYEKNLNLAYLEFEKAQCDYGKAYAKILNNELEVAENILLSNHEDYSFSVWLLILANILQEKDPLFIPTYLQIRNFYEQDLEMFFFFEKYEFIQKLLYHCKYFENSNKEIFKYNGRILLQHGFLKESKKFLEKSLDICFKDPETHFILGELHLKNNDLQKAKKYFIKAIEVNNGYFPALKEIEKLAYVN